MFKVNDHITVSNKLIYSSGSKYTRNCSIKCCFLEKENSGNSKKHRKKMEFRIKRELCPSLFISLDRYLEYSKNTFSKK